MGAMASYLCLLAGSLFVGELCGVAVSAVGLLLALTGVGLLALGWVAFTRFLDEVWNREINEDPAIQTFQLRREKNGWTIS